MSGQCQQCGACCRLFPVPLSEGEYRSGKYKTFFGQKDLSNDFREAVRVGANLLKQKPDGSCIYLKNNRCLIHRFRPEVCRDFFCSSKLAKFQEMIRAIKKEKLKKQA